jgi:hypothetical protein
MKDDVSIIYYFAKDNECGPGSYPVYEIPEDREIVESPLEGLLLFLKIKKKKRILIC